jgi:hypothetical protein
MQQYKKLCQIIKARKKFEKKLCKSELEPEHQKFRK